MQRIKDRFTVGIVGGLVGSIAKMAFDEVSHYLKISQRTFRSTAAGVWVNTRKQTLTKMGQSLGLLLDFALGAIGGIGTVELITFSGKDSLALKGLASGVTLGSITTALLSGLPTNKVKPKDAASNLSYVFSHAFYGLVTAYTVSFIGDPSIFTDKPIVSDTKRMLAAVKK